jgi:FtsP/CotA-like multicopper oxidase with cupredoxin domain
MRSNISTLCGDALQPNALAAIYYNNADTNKAPTSTAWNVPDSGTCTNDDLSLTVPVFPLNAATPSSTQNLDINFYINATGSFLWTLGGTSFRADYNNPTLLQAQTGNLTYDAISNVYNFGSNSTVRIIVNNPTPASHPMHIHGHNMQILHEGAGNYDGVSVVNPSNPQRRDVQLVRANGHFVMQFTLDNPGVWPFHCHIAWHVSGGLYASILERPADIAKEANLPAIMQQTCAGWNRFTSSNVPDEYDSGV